MQGGREGLLAALGIGVMRPSPPSAACRCDETVTGLLMAFWLFLLIFGTWRCKPLALTLKMGAQRPATAVPYPRELNSAWLQLDSGYEAHTDPSGA